MGRQPRSGDFSWLSAHSILNWIGGDTSMVAPMPQKSSTTCKNLHRKENWLGAWQVSKWVDQRSPARRLYIDTKPL